MKTQRQLIIGRDDHSPTSGHEYNYANGHMAQWPIVQSGELGCKADMYDVANNTCRIVVVEIYITVIYMQCKHSNAVKCTGTHTWHNVQKAT